MWTTSLMLRAIHYLRVSARVDHGLDNTFRPKWVHRCQKTSFPGPPFRSVDSLLDELWFVGVLGKSESVYHGEGMRLLNKQTGSQGWCTLISEWVVDRQGVGCKEGSCLRNALPVRSELWVPEQLL